MTESGAETILREVASAVALLEGERGVAEVVDTVAGLEPVGVRRISRAADLPVPIVAAICGELRKRGVVARDRPVQLTPFGRQLFGHDRGSATLTSVCPSCEGREVFLAHEVAGIAAELEKVALSAPRARMEIDQSHCTVETKLRRVMLLHEAGALAGKRILLLGDDDLMSIAIEHVARHYGFANAIREIAVVDVDPAVLAFCEDRLVRSGLRATFIHHDLREPLPSELRSKFDAVLTDPPYTPEGAELFLSRAATGLSPRRGGSVFFCFGMKPSHEALRVQSAIAQMGFVVRRLVRNFNEYEGAGTLAGASHLYHLSATSHTRPLIRDAYTGRLYTGDRRRTKHNPLRWDTKTVS